MECYICYDNVSSPLLFNICKCKDVAIHKECLRKVVESTHSTVCSVCKEEYSNVTIVKRVNYKRARILCIYRIVYVWFIVTGIVVFQMVFAPKMICYNLSTLLGFVQHNFTIFNSCKHAINLFSYTTTALISILIFVGNTYVLTELKKRILSLPTHYHEINVAVTEEIPLV